VSDDESLGFTRQLDALMDITRGVLVSLDSLEESKRYRDSISLAYEDADGTDEMIRALIMLKVADEFIEGFMQSQQHNN